MMRTLSDKINLLAYPWMRAQVMQYMLNPLMRDSNLKILQKYSPTHVKPDPNVPKELGETEGSQYETLRSILTVGYRDDLIKYEPYHDNLVMGGTPITVDIDGNGDIVLIDGGHRILFQLIAGAPAIWANVRRRSPAWIQFVEKADGIADGFVYAKIPHPDFDDCPCARKETRVPALYEVIKDLGIKSAVDLGCCSGSFACDMSVVVPEVHGIDLDKRFVDLARWRAGKTGSQATFSQGSLLDYQGNADLVCCLSVLHHVIHASGLTQTLDWLSNVNCQYLLLEYPTINESILKDSPEGRQFCDIPFTEYGFHLVHDLGTDPGFPAVNRHLSLLAR